MAQKKVLLLGILLLTGCERKLVPLNVGAEEKRCWEEEKQFLEQQVQKLEKKKCPAAEAEHCAELLASLKYKLAHPPGVCLSQFLRNRSS